MSDTPTPPPAPTGDGGWLTMDSRDAGESRAWIDYDPPSALSGDHGLKLFRRWHREAVAQRAAKEAAERAIENWREDARRGAANESHWREKADEAHLALLDARAEVATLTARLREAATEARRIARFRVEDDGSGALERLAATLETQGKGVEG